jgi:hypothetical protein
VAAGVADDALRVARRTRRVEDVDRLGRLDRHALRGLRVRDRLRPLDIPPRGERGLEHRPLEDDAALGLPLDEVDRGVEQRLVRDEPVRLDPARRRHDRLRLGVLDPLRELMRGESAEDHRVHGADPRAGEHRDHSLGDHRHVDDHAVAALHALRAQRPGEGGDQVAELTVRVGALRVGDRRVVDQRRLVGASALDVPVERVVGRVQPTAREPAVERRARVVEDPRRRLVPIDRLRRLGPEFLGLLERAPVHRFVADHEQSLLPSGTDCKYG